ncbi:quinone-dependent dihydroorotate dehydrogenase [Nitratireductor sp. CAU 1489]|uniref:Dihydroorotate dehydrogenase (quinone) n=1 Tax=Nitratireductor arenosus TaxID=2682096 RepID=A0A844QBZ5_9HYPH|nr:quinone-dependent dihydroorotate dehydrogenase [Nitratireductor arenosus]MVA95673.1 quinone-dependent dihydroorotate dehydrogenase [Nitratireductor arenosus]
MKALVGRLGRRALFRLDPETAHGLSIAALKSVMPLTRRPVVEPRLATAVAGLAFPNPLGIAAGYDKNAEVPDALLNLGFGFAEIGTVTPLPQMGNTKPRVFRLVEDDAVINRLGFNNEGHAAAAMRLGARAGRPGVVGVNIGANKEAEDRIGDYVAGVARFAGLASYLTVNISSPNTPGLRNLQGRSELRALLGRVSAARTSVPAIPIFLKIAPDLGETDLDDIAEEVTANGIDGIIVSNTTLARQGLRSAAHAEAGGLSGKPLFPRSTAVLARMRKRLGPDVALIGAGGVDGTEAALEKIRAGADLVQLYTSMIYAGPSLPGAIVAGLARFAEKEGLRSLADIRDSHVAKWVATPIG